MANERYPQDDYYGRRDPQDYGRDYGSGRDGRYSSARDYQAAGSDGREDHGRREQFGRGGHGRGERDSGYYQGEQDRYARGGRGDYDQGGYDRDRGYGGSSSEYHGSYASDGRRFEDVGRYARADDDERRGGSYGRRPQGGRDEDRGFFDRAGDEVRSWFGDEDAERRREMDARRDERDAGEQYGGERYGSESDSHYRNWRRQQMDALDRDYHEYRQQNRSRFESEFGTWRTGRQGQRDLLNKVEEHQEVVGSDGAHVGTVDKVRGDRVILTKNDGDAGGHHHSFPSSWLQSVDDKVTVSKTAADAKAAWKDEERSGAMFGGGRDASGGTGTDRQSRTDLNRSFSGTY